MPDRSLGIALLGCGIVGSGVVRILSEQREMLRRRTGFAFDIRHVVVRDPGKSRGTLPADLKPTPDAQSAIAAKDTDVVIELIGGSSGPAKAAIEQALRLGKPVVTANKSLL